MMIEIISFLSSKHMRRIFQAFLTAAVVLGLYAPIAQVKAATTQSLKGRFLLAVEDQGHLWYVKPSNGMRIDVASKSALVSLAQSSAMVISSRELAMLPTTNLQSLSEASQMMVDKYRGQFVASFENSNQLWYVSPADDVRYDVSTTEKLYAVAIEQSLGVDAQTLASIDEEITADKPAPIQRPTIKTRLQPRKPVQRGTAYTNAQMGWEFASGMWNAYDQYHRAFNNYPELKWFDNIVGYNLPIYFNETGFSLDAGKENYFVWSDFSSEWKTFYKNHFSMKRDMDKDLVYIKFELPSAVETVQYGKLQPGVYYFTNKQGLVTESNFGKAAPVADTVSVEQKASDAKRVFEQALALSKAVEKYRDDVHGYPIAYEQAVEIGVNGNTNLCFYGGFGCHSNQPNNIKYIDNLQSGWPSTKLTYDSRYDGRSYIIAFTIYGTYDQYGPGKYEISPYNIIKVSDLVSVKSASAK